MIERIKRFANKNKVCYGIIYIMFRVYGLLVSLLCFCMRIFPIKQNKIVCCNMKGRRYGDNPKYIIDEIIRQNLDYEIVWLMKNSETADFPEGIRCVEYRLLPMLYELVTAKVWIDSNTKQFGILKRRGQYFIQTWHGSYGLKKIGNDIIDKITRIDVDNLKYSAKIEDLRLSNSRFYSELHRRAFWYQGQLLEYGSPRNDIFFQDCREYREKVAQHFGLEDKHMALYAPTYRNDFGVEACRLDFERLADSLEKRFGGDWVVLVRLHPYNIKEAEEFLQYNNRVMNATDYEIMQELLAACDVLISDYSSCMFDFVTVPKPCFIYATDAAQYKEERDYYFELEELPFPVAENNEELEEVILQFDESKYKADVYALHERVGLCETGKACARVVDYIKEIR